MKLMLATTILASSLFNSASEAEDKSELEQLQGFVKQLGHHLRVENIDTRFIIDRNDAGVFSNMKNVGLVTTTDNVMIDNKKMTITSEGTATILNECFAITSYHVVEGMDILIDDLHKMPTPNRSVKFYYGPINGTHKGFSQTTSGVVVDPKILNLFNRRYVDDIVLIKFTQKFSNQQYPKIELGNIYDKKLNKSNPIDFSEQFFIAAGYPINKRTSLTDASLYADFCNPKSQVAEVGIATNCVLTPGMSGGPLVMYERIAGTDNYTKKIVGLNMQPAGSASGLFNKTSNDGTHIAALTEISIAKIKFYLSKNMDENCNEI